MLALPKSFGHDCSIEQRGKHMIIETSANQFFRVTDHNAPELAHVYCGVAVKKVRGVWVDKANAREVLVRKATTKVIEAGA